MVRGTTETVDTDIITIKIQCFLESPSSIGPIDTDVAIGQSLSLSE